MMLYDVSGQDLRQDSDEQLKPTWFNKIPWQHKISKQ